MGRRKREPMSEGKRNIIAGLLPGSIFITFCAWHFPAGLFVIRFFRFILLFCSISKPELP